jgi:hypothetical protein
MIRATVENGVIRPKEPVPPEWNGREVVITDAAEQPGNEVEDFDTWAQDMNRLAADLNNPAEWEQLEAVLAEADRQTKALVRKEMGLP